MVTWKVIIGIILGCKGIFNTSILIKIICELVEAINPSRRQISISGVD